MLVVVRWHENKKRYTSQMGRTIKYFAEMNELI